MKLARVTKKRPCRVCAHPDWCGISPDGALAVCMRVESMKSARNGGWIHILDESNPRPRFVRKPVAPIVKRSAPASDLDSVYSEFLSNLVLAHGHKADLLRRGFDETDIYTHGFRSMPAKVFSDALCRRLEIEGYDLTDVPGFYVEKGITRFIDYYGATGYLVPIRNEDRKICALTLRRDDGRNPKYLIISSANKPDGASPGVPPHFSYLGMANTRESVSEIIITEGALKSSLIFKFTNVPTIGLCSVTTFSEGFSPLLKKVFPNLQKCSIAFDMEIFDPKNPKTCAFVHVARQRERLTAQLRAHDIDARIITWDRKYKGLDDYLSARAIKKAA